jgi:hypothetical protein
VGRSEGAQIRGWAILLQQISTDDEHEMESGVEQLGQNILLLDFLEVNLRVAVQPVGDLDDVEELQGEHHAAVRVAGPQR